MSQRLPVLHITNGDAAVALLQAAGVRGRIIPWRDVLHLGPVPANLELEELSTVRAAYLAQLGWGVYEKLRRAFDERDQLLRSSHRFDEVILWFEHDLYDQLQLIQVLAWLALQPPPRLSIICIDSYPGIDRFRGLGYLSPKDMQALYPARKSVTRDQLTIATMAWAAFTNPNPSALQCMVYTPCVSMPFLNSALIRWLEEWPSVQNGLSRTAHHALAVIGEGMNTSAQVLKEHWAQEEAPFMGDWAFWFVLKKLGSSPYPLITITGLTNDRRFGQAKLAITPLGCDVLAAKVDAVALGKAYSWYGGHERAASDIDWRWDSRMRRLHASLALGP